MQQGDFFFGEVDEFGFYFASCNDELLSELTNLPLYLQSIFFIHCSIFIKIVRLE